MNMVEELWKGQQKVCYKNRSEELQRKKAEGLLVNKAKQQQQQTVMKVEKQQMQAKRKSEDEIKIEQVQMNEQKKEKLFHEIRHGEKYRLDLWSCPYIYSIFKRSDSQGKHIKRIEAVI